MTKAAPMVEQNIQAAKEAGLVYVSDESPGITRVKKGNRFIYKDPKGKTIDDFAQAAIEKNNSFVDNDHAFAQLLDVGHVMAG